MKIYDVTNSETGYKGQFFNLPAAKKAMRENNAVGFITKVWSNGDWEPAGQIRLRGSNKTFFANTNQKIVNY